jgi:hypothetical protein
MMTTGTSGIREALENLPPQPIRRHPNPALWLDFFQGGKFQMDMSKRAAIALSGLAFAGAAAVLATSAATPASATTKAPMSSKDNGGGGGGGGGTIYNPYQPEKIFIDDL